MGAISKQTSPKHGTPTTIMFHNIHNPLISIKSLSSLLHKVDKVYCHRHLIHAHSILLQRYRYCLMHRNTARSKDIVTAAPHSSRHSYHWLLTCCYQHSNRMVHVAVAKGHKGNAPKQRQRHRVKERVTSEAAQRDGRNIKTVLTSDILIHRHQII